MSSLTPQAHLNKRRMRQRMRLTAWPFREKTTKTSFLLTGQERYCILLRRSGMEAWSVIGPPLVWFTSIKWSRHEYLREREFESVTATVRGLDQRAQNCVAVADTEIQEGTLLLRRCFFHWRERLQEICWCTCKPEGFLHGSPAATTCTSAISWLCVGSISCALSGQQAVGRKENLGPLHANLQRKLAQMFLFDKMSRFLNWGPVCARTKSTIASLTLQLPLFGRIAWFRKPVAEVPAVENVMSGEYESSPPSCFRWTSEHAKCSFEHCPKRGKEAVSFCGPKKNRTD